MPRAVPYLSGVSVSPERVPPEDEFPFNLPFVPELRLTFRKPVVFFVGENGTGKSTLLEAIAAKSGFPVSGGGRNEIGSSTGPEESSELARALWASFHQRPMDGFFLRAEFAAQFATLLDERQQDENFHDKAYGRYGGRSLHTLSHGEAFLAILEHRVEDGLYLLDEPEAALSPQRQLALLHMVYALAASGESQFIIATHSPILLTYPDAQIISFDGGKLKEVRLEDTSHYQITRGILEEPGRYWKYLLEE